MEEVVSGIAEDAYQEAAKKAKEICTISKALTGGVKDISITAKLVRA